MLSLALIVTCLPIVIDSMTLYSMKNHWYGSSNPNDKFPVRGNKLMGEITYEKCQSVTMRFTSYHAFDHNEALQLCVLYKKSQICNDRNHVGGPWFKPGWTSVTKERCAGSPPLVRAEPSIGQPQRYTGSISDLFKYILNGFSFNLNTKSFTSTGREGNNGLLNSNSFGRQSATTTCANSTSIVYGLYVGRGVPGSVPTTVTSSLHQCIDLCDRNTACTGLTVKKTTNYECTVHTTSVTSAPITISNGFYYFVAKFCTLAAFLTTTTASTTTGTTTFPVLNTATSESTTFDCNMAFQAIANTTVTGGTPTAATVNTRQLCKSTCLSSTGCIAADFNSVSNTCFLHTSVALANYNLGTQTCCTHFLRTKGTSKCSSGTVCFQQMTVSATADPQELEITDMTAAGVSTIACSSGLCALDFGFNFALVAGVPTFALNASRTCETTRSQAIFKGCTFLSGAIGMTDFRAQCNCRGNRCNGASVETIMASNGQWSLDNNVFDESPKMRNGRAFGGVTYGCIDAKKNLSASFDGSTGYIELPFSSILLNAPEFNSTSKLTRLRPGFTIGFWMKRNTGTTGIQTVVSQGLSSSASLLINTVFTATDVYSVQASVSVVSPTTPTVTTTTHTVTGTNFAMGTWYWIGLTVTNVGTSSILLNLYQTSGSPPTSITTTFATVTNAQDKAADAFIALSGLNVCLGKQLGTTFTRSQFFNGKIDEVRMYTKALGIAELNSVVQMSID